MKLLLRSIVWAMAFSGVMEGAFGANLTTTASQAAGTDWTAAIWKTNGVGTAVSPTNGNTYAEVANGTTIGNGTSNTRVRNPTAGAPRVYAFPGDSLMMYTNTELRAKQAGIILNFPGVGTNAGLILNGGMLNGGDDGTFPITGSVQVVAQSYISHGATGGGGGISTNRGFNISGILGGTGNMVIINAGTNVPQQVSGASNTYSGQWIVQCGWLQGNAANSLGTNSIIVNPGYTGYLADMPNATSPAGPAWFEPSYDLNSAGVLTLTNGGLMVLHQNCVFTAIRIEGAVLSVGTHPYSELSSNFPANFAPGGSGSLTVQNFGPPIITAQPVSNSFTVGTSGQLSASASGLVPLLFQWQKGTNGIFVNATDTGDVTGSRSNVINFSAVSFTDAADYRVVVTNSAGSATSRVATLTVLAPLGVASQNPLAGSTVSNLTSVQVTFTRLVIGVDPASLLVNGQPAVSVSPTSGGSSAYTFFFTQPPPGQIAIGWDAGQGITDLAGNPFISTAPGANWTYTLVDGTAPVVGELAPAAGSSVGHLTQTAVTFSKPVVGVHASALHINGQPATNVSGSGSGPYIFKFPQPANGTVQFSWAVPNGITDTAANPNAFPGGNWTVTLDPTLTTPTVRINEFLTANISTNGIRDQFGDLEDWIEIYNYGTNAVNLTGYSLTDDPTVPNKWAFSQMTLGAGQFLVVFASGLDLKAIGGTNQLATSFTLGNGGSYLGLFNAELPPVALTEFTPQYPEQRNDVSYGYDSSNQLKYFATPTPGAPNGDSSISGTVADVHFTVERGFFNQPFNLVLTTETPGATIRYTTDGSIPTETTTGTTYSNAVLVSHTTVLRAAAFATNMLPSLVETHSYIFAADVLNQSSNPPGFPPSTNWSFNAFPAEYGVDPDVVTNPAYSGEIVNDLLAIPTLSIVMLTDDIFGPDGIYMASPAGAIRPERACSAELINPDGSVGFQIDCGIKLHGGGSAGKPMKHPLEIKFQSQYGPGSLKYKFFPDSPLSQYDGGLVLRADYNNSWNHALSPYTSGSLVQRARGELVRDAFYKDVQTAMGDFSSHSRYVHLYINGLYWGVYNPCEDPDQHFAADYLGGDSSDYDTIKGSDFALSVNGDTVAYNTMLSYNNGGLTNLAQYNQIKQYLDVTQYADYILLQFYGANQDWATAQNWIAIRNKKIPGSLFEYICWDDERTLEGVNDTAAGSPLNSVSPSDLQRNLVLSPEYRLLFADRAYRHLFNNGALTTNSITQLWLARAAQLQQAIVGESARWGNEIPGGKLPLSPLPYPTYTTNNPYYSRNENWLGEQGRLLSTYFPFRTAIVLNQLKAAGLYPSFDPPVFNQFGGNVPFGFNVTLSATNGTIYYTTNGADPRLYGTGGISPQASAYSGPITLNASTIVRARVLSGTNWSALADASFSVASLGVPLRFTEIMYNPPGGSAYTYVEIQNIGSTPVDASNFSVNGIGFTFLVGTVIQPGQVVLLASGVNPSAFAARYPSASVFGYFNGTVSSTGERLAILDANGNIITAVNYKATGGWPTPPNGGGYSLEVVNPNGDPDDPANWRTSLSINGSPGFIPVVPPSNTVRFNEIMAENVGAVTNGTTTNSDWLELFNPSTNSLDLSNWSLSNSGNARKYVFPGGTAISAGGYLVVWCDSVTTAPGLHSGFNLGRKGENLFLYDANTNRVDAFSFGLQLTNYTVGRVGSNGTWQLTVPTPGALNVAAAVGPPTSLVINEWLANSATSGSDWLELYNTSPTLPVTLTGLYLATSNQLFQVHSLSFIQPLGYVQLFADENVGPDHLDFKISAAGDALVLYDYSGQTIVDRVSFVNQLDGISQGRYPDGSTNIIAFPGTASPAAPNFINTYTGPVLNEFMARNTSAVFDSRGNTPDWLELYNPAPTNFSLAGMGLSVGQSGSPQWLFPAGTAISSNGFLLVWCDPSRPASTNFEVELNFGSPLPGDGGALYLFNTNGQAVDSVAFGFQVSNLSLGKSGGAWHLLSSPTPIASNSAPVALGSSSNLTINEWLASPGPGSNDWFELYNAGPLPVDLSGLYVTDTPSLSGMTNSPTAVLSFIAGHGWVQYQADSTPSAGPSHVRFNLSKDGETIHLYDTNLVQIDEIDFGLQSIGVSQGRYPDGSPNIFFMVPTPDAANMLSNSPPVLNSLGDRIIYLGQTLKFIASATDPDTAQTLTFALTNSPAGATINPTNGTFNWAVTNVPAPSTNSVTVTVTDNGVPPLSDSRTFHVFVLRLPQITSVGPDGHGNLLFTFTSFVAQSYQLQFKNSLSDAQWTPLGTPTPGNGGTLTLSASMSASSQRFFRLVATSQ